MALSGNFYNYPVSQFGLYCEWTGVQSPSTNSTTITLKVYLRYYTISVSAREDGKVSINGVQQTYSTSAIEDMSSTSWHNVLLTTKTQKVTHNADGTKTDVALSASWRFGGPYSGISVDTITASTTVDLDPITTYTLSTSAGTGSSITVNRTASGYAATGNISNDAMLYLGDKLKITFTPSTNYAIATHTVNGSTFSSGNTHTVSGNVSVASTAQVLASSVGATNADIGSTSTITVMKYNTSYYHSLQYSFGSVSGYITADGATSSTEVKLSQTSVAFTVPTTFYAQIPNAKTGICTITCRTYSSSSSATVLGTATTCAFTATASANACSPTVSGTVVDINTVTVALTGDSSKLIRYKSTAQCTITATAKNSATIAANYINDVVPTDNVRIISGVSATSFVFKTTDSRGYTTLNTRTPTMVAYINLTCNPIISRPTPAGSSIVMTLSGDLYRGSFGAYTNTLTLRYRYKQSGGVYGEWATISSGIVYGTSTYSSGSAAISLGDNFDYQKDYVFQVNAYDGAGGNILTNVTKTIPVARGTPVFDWSEDDFNVNVPFNATGDITVDGHSIYIKQQTLSLTEIPVTTQSANGVCYCNSGYTPADYNISGAIIGLMVTSWSGATASFVPYYSDGKISFMSDVPQTIGQATVLVTYI